MATQPRVTPIAGRYANKPGKFLVRSVMAVRELSDAELEKIPGFVRKTTEGIIFDTQSNAQKFVKSDLLKNVKAAAIESRAETSGIARQKKSRNPKLFNKIMQLAEEGKTSVGKIGTHPEVVKLNNGRPITYVNIQNIITREKGKDFFNKVAKTKQYYKSPNRISLEKNLNNLMKDYYKGTGTVKLTETYLPNSPDAKRGTSATVLEDVIKENIDPKKLAKRPAVIGANQYGTRKEQIKVLKDFQNYLSKNTKKFTSKALAESNLKDLFKGSDSGTIGNFVARTNILRKAYNSKNLPEGFKVNQKVKDLIKYLPVQDFVESELRALGFSEKTIKSMEQVETAVQKMTTASTQLEHALPRSIIRGLNLPKKYHLMGERTTNFLNKFKMQFDAQMTNAAMAYAQSNQTPADYKKYITKVNQIRDKVRKLTGGYEMGWVDFDKAGNAIPKTNQMSFLRKGDAESVKAKGIENFKKNIQYHNALKKNFDKNPTSPDFFTLREEISESPRKFVEEVSMAQKINAGDPKIKKAVEARVGCAEGCLVKVANEEPGKITRALNSIKNFFVPKPEMPSIKYDDTLGAFVNTSQNKWADEVVSQADLKAWAKDNPMPVQAGTSVKPGLLRKTGRALAHVGLPLPTAAMDTYFIGRQIEEGRDPVDIAKDPFNWLGLATMEPLTKAAGMADKSGKLASVMRLGMSPGMIRGATRFLGLPGLAISTALTGYDQYKKYQNKEGFIYDLFNKVDNTDV